MKKNKTSWAIALALAGTGLSTQVLAFDGYSANVRNACSAAARPAPKIAADDCSTCHTSNRASSTPAQKAYKAGGTTLLNYFCAAAAVNHAPTISAPSTTVTTVTGSSVSFKVSGQDSDAGDTVTLSATLSGVPGATFNAATGQFSWTAAAAQTTPYQVVFKATDKAGLSATTTVLITVNAAPVVSNRAPVVSVASNTLTAVSGANVGFTVSAQDPDAGDVVTLSAVLSAVPGASFDPATGKFSWTAGAAQTLPYQVVFKATDKAGLSSSTTVSITVRASNTTPVNTAPSLTVPLTQQNASVGQALSFVVTATDAEGDDVSISTANLPAGATLSTAVQDAASGEWQSTFSWTPDTIPAVNPQTLTFTATDAPAANTGALSSSKTVSILVNQATNTATISALNFGSASWNDRKGRLTASGVVMPLAGQRLARDFTLSLVDADTGMVLASGIHLDKKGRWKFTSSRNYITTAPCQITAMGGGLTATTMVSRGCLANTTYDDSGDDNYSGHSDSSGKQSDSGREGGRD